MGMIIRLAALWIVGLVTIVPYGIYHLLFTAGRDEYAFLITIVLFWIFGYWSIVMPLVSLVKLRRLYRSLEAAGSKEELMRLLERADSEEVAIDLIASEHRIPKFLARRIYRWALERLGPQIASG